MSDNEKKLIQAIRTAEDPNKMMDYIEELLLNPQKFQEALKTLAAPQGT